VGFNAGLTTRGRWWPQSLVGIVGWWVWRLALCGMKRVCLVQPAHTGQACKNYNKSSVHSAMFVQLYFVSCGVAAPPVKCSASLLCLRVSAAAPVEVSGA
jgi:hypothetical protein